MKKLAGCGAIGCMGMTLAAACFAALFVVIIAGAASAVANIPVIGGVIGWVTSMGAPSNHPGGAPSGVELWTPTPIPSGCFITPTPVIMTVTPDSNQPTPVPPNTAAPPASIAVPTATPCPTPKNSFNTPNPHEPPIAPGDGPHGSPLGYWTVTQRFGCTPETYENYEPSCAYPHRFHTGVDISTSCNAPIRTTIGGRVVIAGWNSGGFGQWVAVEGQDTRGNTYRVFYPHLASILVSVGQNVGWGQTIGLEGTTGNSTGCHTHYMIYVNGFLVDSAPYLPWPAPGGSQSPN